MIVVDTNLIAYLMLPGERAQEARAVFRRDANWTSPLLWRSEFRNVLAQYLRRAQLDLAGVARIMDEAENVMRGGEYEVRSPDVLRLVSASRCSAYDCEFVALAEDLHVPLITVDGLILREFPSIAISAEDFVGPSS